MSKNNNNQPSILGRSLKIIDGDLDFAGRDLTLITGRSNFLQGTQMMIETPFETDIFNVNYGFEILNVLSLPENIRMIKELIRLNIVKSLSLDDRLREIREIVFNDEPRYFELNPKADREPAQDARKNSRQTISIFLFLRWFKTV